MKKVELENFIKRYYLGGRVNSVVWSADGKNLETFCVSDDRDVVAKVTLKDCNFEESKFGIYDTKCLLDLIGVFDDEFEMNLRRADEKVTSLKLKEKNNTAVFMLSDVDIIPVPKLKFSNLPEWQVKVKINEAFADKFVKGVNALDENSFTVLSDSNKTEIVIGHSAIQSNRISLQVSVENSVEIEPISFSAKVLKEILTVNSADIENAMLCITEKGLAYIEFSGNKFESKYYLPSISSS